MLTLLLRLILVIFTMHMGFVYWNTCIIYVLCTLILLSLFSIGLPYVRIYEIVCVHFAPYMRICPVSSSVSLLLSSKMNKTLSGALKFWRSASL